MNQYRALFHLFLLLIVILICYGNTLNNTFHFDDQPNITKSKNQHLTELSWQGIKKAAYFDEGGVLAKSKLSRPVSRISLALNYYFHGLNVTGYHIVNISIHILTAFILYFLSFEILKSFTSSSPAPRFELGYLQEIALLGAFLWAMHPIQVQAVTYIVQRMASLAAMFYLLAFYLYIRGRCEPKVSRRAVIFILAGCCWMLGLLSKENAIFLPISILFYEFIFFRISKKVKFWIFLLVLFLTAISISFLIIFEINIFDRLLQYQHRTFTLWERLLTEQRIIWRYIFLLLTPLQDFLTLESDIRPSTGFFHPYTTFFSAIGNVSLVVGAWCLRRRLPLVSFSILFFFINHIVESTFIALELYFEHRNYLPSVFIYLTIAWYLAKAWRYCDITKKILLKWLIIFASIFIMTNEGLATWMRNDVWRNDLSLFTDCIQKSPESLRSYGTLSAYYLRQKEYELAKKQLKIAEQLYKKYPERYQNNFVALIYHNAGVVHGKLENYKKSQRLFMRSLQLDPSSYETSLNFASSSFKIGELSLAEQGMLNGIALMSDEGKAKALAYNMLGFIYYQQNNVEKALKALKKGLTYDSLTILRINIMSCYIQLGDISAAQKTLRYTKRNNNDLLQLLIRALLQSEESRTDLISQITNLLTSRKIDYCEWIQDVKTNKRLGIIVPDITSLENQLLNAYNTALNNQIITIQEVGAQAANCLSTKNIE